MRLATLVTSLFVLASLPAAEVAPPTPQPTPPVESSQPAASATSAATTPAWTIPTDDAVKIAEAIEIAIAHGMPDTKGGAIFDGTLLITGEAGDGHEESANPFEANVEGEDPPPVRITSIPPPGTATEVVTEKPVPKPRSYSGLHIRMADGSWLVGMKRVVKPGKDIVFDQSKLKEVKPENMRTAFTARHQPSPEEIARVEEQTPVELRSSIGVILRWQGLLERLGWGGDMAGSIAALVRVGVPDAHELTVVFGFMRAQMGMMAGDETGSGTKPLLLTEADQTEQEVRQNKRWERMASKRVAAQPPKMVIDPIVVATRRALSDWFRAKLSQVDVGIPPERAAQAIGALLEGQADPGLTELIRLFKERAALPDHVAATADLATKLTVWEPDEREDGQGMSKEDLAQLPAEMRAQFQAQIDAAERAKKAPQITESDIPGLIDLLGDARACRWLDEERQRWSPMSSGPTPRTIGDNALRAVTTLLAIDLRRLIGRDVYAPWTSVERVATAAAAQAWWKAGNGKSISELLVAAVPGMNCGTLAAVIEARPATERPTMIAAVAAQWKLKAPSRDAAQGFGRLLALIGEEAAITPLVKLFPVTETMRMPLAIWGARHQDAAALDQLFEETLTAPNDEHRQSEQVLAIVSAFPTPARLARLMTVNGDWSNPASRGLMGATLSSGSWNMTDADCSKLLEGVTHENGGQTALHHAVVMAMLGDRRAIPDGHVKVQGDMVVIDDRHWISVMRSRGTGKKKEDPLVLPADLRTCDLAAYHMVGHHWEYREDREVHEVTEEGFPIAGPIADRDVAIALLRTKLNAILLKEFTAAKLPTTLIPGAGAPAGDDKALF